MASITKRKAGYAVIYYNGKLPNGKRKQVWESGYTYHEALKRKAEIDYQQSKGQTISPKTKNITVSESVEQWIKIHAINNWQFSTYTNALSLLNLHILPYVGNLRLRDVRAFDIEQLISTVFQKSNANFKNGKEKFISSTTVKHIYILLKQVFEKALEWGLINDNPVKCKAPKRNHRQLEIWGPKEMEWTIANIENPLLRLAVHMSFICSLRLGELLAVTIEDINFENNSININKTLQRVSNHALKQLAHNEIIRIFDAKIFGSASSLILKEPKTISSNRKVYLTESLVKEIKARFDSINCESSFYGWSHNGLLFCLPQSGNPIEPKLCSTWFRKWQEENGVSPLIPFHRIRHCSSTYKLHISGGDIKAVQGDTGHASTEMLMDIYAQIWDKNRREIVQKIEKDFYHD